ncbi:P44-81 outer membrane protein, truncated, partial [Anaplasma phagocytophilum str. HZ]
EYKTTLKSEPNTKFPTDISHGEISNSSILRATCRTSIIYKTLSRQIIINTISNNPMVEATRKSRDFRRELITQPSL